MNDIVVYDNFEIVDTTKEFIKQYATSRYCPDQWKLIDKSGKRQFPDDETRITEMEIAYVYGRSLGLNLFSSLKYIAVINGQPCAWGDALVALVQASGELTGFSEWIDGEKDNRVAFCRMQRKNGTDITKTFSVQNAKDAGLWNNEKKKVWNQYPDIMLAARARGFCIRAVFADILQGLITKEEAEDYPEIENSSFEQNTRRSPIGKKNNTPTPTQITQEAVIVDNTLTTIPETEKVAVDASEIVKQEYQEKQKVNEERTKFKKQMDTILTQFVNSSIEIIEARTTSEKYHEWVLQLQESFPDVYAEYNERLTNLIDEKMKSFHGEKELTETLV